MRRNTFIGLPILAAAVLLLAACGSTSSRPATATAAPAATPAPVATPAAPADDDAGYIVVYRQKRILGAALNTSVYLDGVETVELDPGTYVRLKAAPGPHRIWADEEKDAFAVTVEAGRTLYVRMELVPGLWKGHGRMVAVDEAAGSAEFASWQPKPAKSVHNASAIAW